MPFVPATNVVMVEARCILEGQHVENRFMCLSPSAVDAAKLEAVANAVDAWWEGAYANILPDTVLLTEIIATDLSVENGDQFTFVPSGEVRGAIVGGALPNEVSLCISFRSGFRGRSARGRMYSIAVPIVAMATANDVASSFVVSANAVGQSLIDNLAAIAPLVVLSYVSTGAPRVGGPITFVVTSASVTDPTVDSMKRRKPGVGT